MPRQNSALRAFSPDLNPVGMAFSRLKTLIRKAAARTCEALWKKVGVVCDPCLPQECGNCFEGPVAEIAGPCLDLPDRAVVPCVDEKSQIRALDRTRPCLPLEKGRAAAVTHGDKRHRPATLFAAPDVKSGQVTGECLPRHRAGEFLKFLRNIDKAVPAWRGADLILDGEADQKTVRGTVFPLNATQKTPDVQAWLEKHPRFKRHFTPAGASLAEPRRTVPCRDHTEAKPTRQLFRRR